MGSARRSPKKSAKKQLLSAKSLPLRAREPAVVVARPLPPLSAPPRVLLFTPPEFFVSPHPRKSADIHTSSKISVALLSGPLPLLEPPKLPPLLFAHPRPNSSSRTKTRPSTESGFRSVLSKERQAGAGLRKELATEGKVDDGLRSQLAAERKAVTGFS